ncbi:hypothetical protein [Bacillus sp. RS11]|uniref:hypothetical protein n=1 Tax=Lysinibacillus sp. RS11 TaxID=3242682 RepID=UPI0035C66E47
MLSLRFHTDKTFADATLHYAFAQSFLRASDEPLGPTDVFCAKAKRQQHDVFCAKAKRQQHDVGHEGVITGRDVFSLCSSIANPQAVGQSPLQSTK